MTMLSIDNVTKRYGTHTVLDDIRFDVPAGTFTVLVGPSGCGKSTLLRSIAGLETITAGAIHIGERRVNDLSPRDRDIAMVFQNYALYPHMTVAENMGFSLRLSRAPRIEIEKKVADAADVLGLAPLLGRYPRQLSGGQRQRVAMGRAIVREPKIFLFDEPLSNLDAKLRGQMRTEIRALQQRLGTTTVYVTHDQIEAMTMADQIVIMRAGHVVQVGSPLDLYDRPVDLFVAGFIGAPGMNFLKGRLTEAGFQPDGVEGRFLLPFRPAPQALGRDLVCGIRPEHLHPAAYGLPTVIEVVEPTGAETVFVSLAGPHRLTTVVRDRTSLRAGDPLAIAPEPDKLHFFDPGTERRLDPEELAA